MKPERIKPERLQAMLDHANQKAREEDCLHRLSLRAERMRQEQNHRRYIIECWGGDIL